jgi:8-oxo-dGTP pyrophosphatase MutT (NUDIX family)
MNDGDPSLRPWTQGPERVLLSTPIFDVCSRDSASTMHPSRSGDFYSLRCPDWVNVVALTPDRKVVMVEQFRHGLGQMTLELPGGVKEAGESVERACLRELAEETGYRGTSCEIIGRVSANPAIQGNWVSTGLVRDVTAGPAKPDGMEEIVVHLVPLDTIPTLVRQGTIHHALIVAAIMHSALARV